MTDHRYVRVVPEIVTAVQWSGEDDTFPPGLPEGIMERIAPWGPIVMNNVWSLWVYQEWLD